MIKDPKTFDGYIANLDKVGFQSTQIAAGAEILKQMWKNKATVYLAVTANIIASGMRGMVAELMRKKLINVIVTTGGALDHDIIKSIEPYDLTSFTADDVSLHKNEINRIGNIAVSTSRYITLESVCKEIFPAFVSKPATPTSLAKAFGEWIGKNANKESSFLYWAAKNKIPVFSPGITDSAIGLQSYFFKQQHKGFMIDVTGDMKDLANITLNADKTGAIVLGGGISKHHVIGVNLTRGGLDYAVYVSTATEFDGSLSGARSSEAISWGKIKEKASHVDIHAEVSIALPLLLKKAGAID
jgi:deoxyhypusine synthase